MKNCVADVIKRDKVRSTRFDRESNESRVKVAASVRNEVRNEVGGGKGM